jgi:hypothetical protein
MPGHFLQRSLQGVEHPLFQPFHGKSRWHFYNENLSVFRNPFG